MNKMSTWIAFPGIVFIFSIYTPSPAAGQNLISRCDLQDYKSFVRVSLAMSEPPRYSASRPPGNDGSMADELRIEFANALLASAASCSGDSIVHVRLSQLAQSKTVIAHLTLQQPFTYSAFYFAPKKTFIIDLLAPSRITKVTEKRTPPRILSLRMRSEDGTTAGPARPTGRISMVEQARLALARGDTATALLVLQRQIAAAPMQAAANYQLGLIRQARGDLEMARQNFLRAATTDSSFTVAAREQIAAIDEQLQRVAIMAARSRPSPREGLLSDSAGSVLSEPASEQQTMRSIDLTAWRRWLAKNRTNLWRLSILFTVLGLMMLASQFWSARKSKRRAAQSTAPPKFSLLLSNNLRQPAAQIEKINAKPSDGNGAASVEHEKKVLPRPFELPAPVSEAAAQWSMALSSLTPPEAGMSRLEQIAQRLKVGQGEVSLHFYLSKRTAAQSGTPASAQRPRLTFLEN